MGLARGRRWMLGALAACVLALGLWAYRREEPRPCPGPGVERSQAGVEPPSLRGAPELHGVPPATAGSGPEPATPAEEPVGPEPPGRTIRGRVIDGTGQGVAELPVSALVPAPDGRTSLWRPIAVSDAEGRFEGAAPSGTTWLRASPGPAWVVPRTARVPPDGREVVLRVLRAAPVRGVVLGPLGHPVEGARVKADAAHRHTLGAGEPTGPDGRFQLSVPARVSPVLLWCDAPHPLEGDDGHVWKAETWIELPASDEVVLRFGTGVAIEGEVVDHRGRPVETGRVDVRPADEERPAWVLGGLSWEAGRFRIARLAPGPYWVSFERWSYEQATPDPVLVVAPARGVRIVCPAPCDLAGRVVGPGSGDFFVTYARRVPGREGRQAQDQRANAGAFRFRGMSAAPAVLYAYRPGDDRYALRDDVRAPDDTCTLVLQEGLRVEGRLRPPVEGFGSQPPKIGVQAPFYRRAEPVAADGTFVLTGLPAGRWQLLLVDASFRGPVRLGEPVEAGTTGVALAYPE